MSRFLIFVLVALHFSVGCIEHSSLCTNSGPVILTLYWPDTLRPGEQLEMSLSGHLMSSNAEELGESPMIRMVSGTIDDRPARGFALHSMSSEDKPVFHVLVAVKEKSEQLVVAIEGYSSVEWLLAIKPAERDIITTEGLEPPSMFMSGPFEFEVRSR